MKKRRKVYMRYKSAVLLLIGVFIIGLLGCSKTEKKYAAAFVRPPYGTNILGPAILLPHPVMAELKIEEGDPIKVIHKDISLELRVFDIRDTAAVFSMIKKYRDSLKIEVKGLTTLYLIKPPLFSGKLKAKPFKIAVENYSGDRNQWKAVAIGAPHGDCDWETGQIVKQVAAKFGIPATAAYGARLGFMGIWYDMNRPLMKLPKKEGGLYRERVWNEDAEKVYDNYQNKVLENSKLSYGKRFELYCSFHGHDLSVTLKNGERIERPVIEGMGIGFRKEELRAIKKFYDRHKFEYYEVPPMLVFGNLPEDRVYYYHNIPLNFFYSGLGTRVYGSLRSDLVKRALHLETPNTMRLDKKVQPQTAKLLHDVYRFILDSLPSLPAPSATVTDVRAPELLGKCALVVGGEFTMGAAADAPFWSSEKPAHKVKIAPFEMDYYEVTNKQYADFLNEALAKGMITVNDGKIYGKGKLYCKTVDAAPMSQLIFAQGKFKAVSGKEYFPVIFVSWYGAKAYAEFYNCELPTEAQWEAAASYDFKKNLKYVYGYRSNYIEADKANFEDNGTYFAVGEQAGTSPVGYYNAVSPNGIYDMSGNVMEWCSDYYKYGFYKKEGSLLENPTGPKQGTMRTVRGGAWNLEPWICRTTFRLGVGPEATLVNVGFRCVRNK